LSAFIDARTLPSDASSAPHPAPDLAIIGGGPAGIALAMALADTKLKILLLESGGMNFDPAVQKMYAGSQTGYEPLDADRLRYLGGGTNHWGGWCRPMDESDFEVRAWVPSSGWPFGRAALEPYYPRAQSLVEAGAWAYDQGGNALAAAHGPMLRLGKGGVYTTWFQFSKMRGDVLPTQFGHRYEQDLRAQANLTVWLNANVTAIRLASDAASVDRLDVATLNGKRFTVKPRYTVLACGGIENARLLLVSNDVMKPGIGNMTDQVGRYFADNPVPRDVATLVVFAGKPAPYYGDHVDMGHGAILRAAFAPTDAWRRQARVGGSLTTVEQPVELDEIGKAAVATTAAALGADASSARAFSLGCGLELIPDPERRVTLTPEKDALGLPRPKLANTISDEDFARYRRTLAELGRQLLASKTGMLRINHTTRDEWMKGMEWGHHHLGTTRMHDDPRRGVVDANARVHGVPNLYIAGSSIFPSYSASNPTMNLIALTLRLADHLKTVLA
jgi:choline dehydrogenase-like flavoprotein